MANYNYSNNRQNSGYSQPDRGQAEIVAQFKAEWITKEIDKECVDFCDRVAHYLADKKVSSSLLRNIYGELKRIEAKGFAQCRTDFFLMQPKIAYTIARNDKKEAAQLFNDVYRKMANSTVTEKHFDNLVRMCEAIIAYHKTYNPK